MSRRRGAQAARCSQSSALALHPPLGSAVPLRIKMLNTVNQSKPTNSRRLLQCAHCGLPTFATNEQSRVFCCNGCMGAFAMIHELGLNDFYTLRDASKPVANSTARSRVEILDDLEAAGVDILVMPDGLCSVRLSVDGIHCAACSWLIDRFQPSMNGLHSAQVRMSDQTIELIYDPKKTHPANVARRLARLGYGLSPWIANNDYSHVFLAQQREHWAGIALAAFFAANAMWIGVALYAGESTGISNSHEYFLRWVGTILAIFAAVFPGRIYFQTAWQAIQTHTPHVDIPVAVSLFIGVLGGIVGAVRGVGQIYFDSLASLVLLLRIGRYIQFRAQYRTSLAVSQLLRLNSVVATRIESDGTEKLVPAQRLKLGDRVLVKPGEAIPADGVVLSEKDLELHKISSVDLSLISGESTPVSVKAGDTVVGGTTNLSSPLTISVTAAGEASRAGRLMEMVRNATTHRTPWIQAADRVGKWFVMVVLFLSVCTWCVWSWIADMTIATQHTMALLTIACPCALALAAPLVLTVALGRAAKKQIWIRDGNCLERLANPGMLWLDKTGTLTYGRMSVLEWHGDDQWLAFASAVEDSLGHPIARAIKEFANQVEHDQLVQVATKVQNVNGKGARGLVAGHLVCIGNQAWMSENGIDTADSWNSLHAMLLERGQSVAWLAIDASVVGLFGLGDSIRVDAVETLRSISAKGWRIGLISGDRQEIVDQMADNLRKHGIELDAVLGEHVPEQKLEVIRQCQREREGTCVMVGDGINDAAALSVADVGIALRGGSDQSLQAAPIFLANQRLSVIVELLDSAQSVVRGIRRCFVASLVYNGITIGLAMTGWIHPLVAAILMPISGLTVLTMAIMTKSFNK